MYCNYHPNRVAIMQCRKCGKCLCEECAEATLDGLCRSCQSKTLAEDDEQRNMNVHWYKQTLKIALYCGGASALLLLLVKSSLPSWPWSYYLFSVFVFFSTVIEFLYIKKLLSRNDEEKSGCSTIIIALILTQLSFFLFIVPLVDLIVGLIKGKGFIPIESHK